MGLDRGGSCKGMAFQVANHHKDEVVGYLRKRELSPTSIWSAISRFCWRMVARCGR